MDADVDVAVVNVAAGVGCLLWSAVCCIGRSLATFWGVLVARDMAGLVPEEFRPRNGCERAAVAVDWGVGEHMAWRVGGWSGGLADDTWLGGAEDELTCELVKSAWT